MEHYLDLDNLERVANDFPEWLTDNFDYLISSARLLGTDLARCMSSVSSPELAKLIAAIHPTNPERSLAVAMSRSVDDLASCQALVDAFSSGLPR